MRRLLGGRGGVAADVAPHDEPVAGAAQPLDGPLQTPVGEAHAVDQRAVALQAEDARARVARLLPRCHGPHLDEPEAQGGQLAHGVAVAVEARGQPNGVGEAAAEDLAPERGVVHGAAAVEQPPPAGDPPHDAQREQHEAVGPFDGQSEEQRSDDSVVHGRVVSVGASAARGGEVTKKTAIR